MASVVSRGGAPEVPRLHAQFGGALTRIAVSRAEPVGPFQGWRPLMPVTQWSVVKSSDASDQQSAISE